MSETLDEGKLLLHRGEYEKAANIFQEFLHQKVQEFGDMAEECAEIYYLYGRTLYEIGKVETDSALKQILNIATSAESAETKSLEVMETIKNGTLMPTVALKDEEEEGEGEADGETETFELAWQWLDLARIIFTNKLNSLRDIEANEVKTSLAECYLILGRIGLETESNSSVEDLNRCLDYQLEVLQPTDPKLSFTQLQIAIGYQLLFEYDKAMISLQNAVSRLDEYRKKVEEGSDEDDDGNDPEEVDDLYGKIQEKMDELQKLMAPKSATENSDAPLQQHVVDLVKNMFNPQPTPQNVNKTPPKEVRNLGVFGKSKGKLSSSPTSGITISDANAISGEEKPKIRDLGVIKRKSKRDVECSPVAAPTSATVNNANCQPSYEKKRARGDVDDDVLDIASKVENNKEELEEARKKVKVDEKDLEF